MENKPLKIAHVSDIHIFHSKRHEEHRKLIRELAKTLKEEKVDLIYVGGDVQDSKSKLSPEQLELVNFFFYALSEIAPMIVIMGNHDTNLQAKSRLDSLTPIISNIQSTNPIYYLRDTGTYHLFGIDWLVWSRLDDKNPLEGFKKEHYTIGCYHGPITGAKTDSGYDKFSATMSEKDFELCDSVMLGDIHKTQFFRSRQIAYSGSLIQYKIDESERKGILIWDWDETEKNYDPRFVRIHNDFGYKTFNVSDLDAFDVNKVVLLTNEFVCRLLYTGDETTYSFTKFNEIRKQVKSKIPNQILIQKRFSKRKSISPLKNLTSSKDFFIDYFDKFGIDKAIVKELKKVDQHYESLIDSTDYQVGEYFIKELEIHNFLCFGSHNIIDFEDIKGLVGLFAKNGYGKSSLFHSIMFCLFNKTPKDSKGSFNLINDQLDEVEGCFVQIKLLINGIIWRVKRNIVPKRDGSGASIRLEVYEGEEEKPRHLESRPQTDKQVLQPLLGDENIFLTTVLSSQKDPTEFVDNENFKRLDLVIKFLGILLYDSKFKLVDKDLKQEETVRAIMWEMLEKLTSRTELEKSLDTLNFEIDFDNTEICELEKIIKEDLIEHKKNTKHLSKLSLIGTVKTEEQLKEDLASTKKLSEDDIKTLKQCKELRTELLRRWNTDDRLIGKLNEWKLVRGDKIKEEAISIFRAEIINLKTQLDSKSSTIECPNCNHTWHTVDKEKIKVDIESKTKSMEILKKEIEIYNTEQEKISKLQEEIKEINRSVISLEDKIPTLEKKVIEIQSQLKIIEVNKNKIIEKDSYEKVIKKLNDKLEKNRERKTSLETTNAIRVEQIKGIEEKIKFYDDKIIELREKDNLINNLTLYKSAMHRTGIPSMVLQNFIPLINYEVNSHIGDLFDSSIEFELDENSLNVYYIKENLNKTVKRNVAQACGQESAVINLAIRAALTKMSLLPKPSLLLLDELFSVLDPENLEKMHELVMKLKDQYQNIILITHTEEIKDWPEYFIKLHQTSGITSIN